MAKGKKKEQGKEKEKEAASGNGEDKELKEKIIEGDTKEKKEEETKENQEELIKELQEEINKLATKDIIIQMMMSLSSLAYKKMGLPVEVNDKYK